MTIITKLANGNTEIFETQNYIVSKAKDFHPALLSVSVFQGDKKIFKKSRHFQFFYKHFIFKSEKVQSTLKNLEEQRRLAEEAKEN
mgnify:CR=1 FL=1|nr:MAG TPA: hypothetical protein [Bacteriophage sp.]